MHKLLTLIITIAILYLIIERKTASKPQDQIVEKAASAQQITTARLPAEDNSPATGNFVEKALSNVLVNILKTEEGKLFFENILQPINRPIAGVEGFKVNNADLIKSMFKISDTGNGTVGPASCGHIATISYIIMDLSNNIVEEKTTTFSLGARPEIPALDSIVVGMMVGQTRNAVIPAKYAYYNDKYKSRGIDRDGTYKVQVTLRELMPQNFAKSDVKIFDDEIAYKVPLMCGDSAIFHAKITKLANGEVIYDSGKAQKKLAIRIGDMNYPMIFSHALYGKIPTGTRTIIANGSNYKALGMGNSIIFPKEQLPANEYFMLELSDFESLRQ